MHRFLWFATCLGLTCEINTNIIKQHQTLHIKSIKGQLYEKVTKILTSTYWKNPHKKDKKIDIEYEIFEFLNFLIIKGKIKLKNKIKTFTIRYEYSDKNDWKHDAILVDTIAREIHFQAQCLLNN